MGKGSLRHVWIVFSHEYLQRIRTRSFVLTTLLMPAFMLAIIAIPVLAAMHQNRGGENIVLVCAQPDLAGLIRDELGGNRLNYRLELDSEVSGAERDRLLGELNSGRIDGYLWIDSEAIASGKVIYARRDSGDFLGQQIIRIAVSSALASYRLGKRGIAAPEARELLAGVELDPVTVTPAAAAPGHGIGAIFAVIVLTMVLFVTLLSYGVMVMRSVLEEKASRVIEILLCSATAEDLMAGKILGVGAVGLTQVSIWGVLALLIAAPSMARGGVAAYANVSVGLIACFAVFYVLGYLLYSAMFAAVGAAFNSTDEAQQWNFVVISPLILASTLMSPVASAPSSTLAVITSMIPFCAPVLMFQRILLQRPPAWQIAASIGLLIATTWAALRISARVYRVGILMYGKRPTVRELAKWLKYA